MANSRVRRAVVSESVRAILAIRLKEWRLGMRLPMKVVAAEVGVSESTYSLWESGRRFPNAENLDAIAVQFRMPLCMLFRNGNPCPAVTPGKETTGECSEQTAAP